MSECGAICICADSFLSYIITLNYVQDPAFNSGVVSSIGQKNQNFAPIYKFDKMFDDDKNKKKVVRSVGIIYITVLSE